MATIKSFTSLEQSKVLAKILPLESADMCWCNNSIKGVNYTDEFSANLYTVKEMKELFDTTLNGWDKYWELIPCWSLSALLDVLPQKYYPIKDHETNLILGKPKDKWCALYWDAMGMQDGEQTLGDSPVDACVAMIEKLNELKRL